MDEWFARFREHYLVKVSMRKILHIEDIKYCGERRFISLSVKIPPQGEQ